MGINGCLYAKLPLLLTQGYLLGRAKPKTINYCFSEYDITSAIEYQWSLFYPRKFRLKKNHSRCITKC